MRDLYCAKALQDIIGSAYAPLPPLPIACSTHGSLHSFADIQEDDAMACSSCHSLPAEACLTPTKPQGVMGAVSPSRTAACPSA